jgi:hypothetical protein
MSGVKVGGAWKTPSIVYTKVGGQWKIVGQSFAKINGTWRTTTFGSPPPSPIMAYVSTGVFSISNYDSTLTYTATLVSGTGTATFAPATGRYTLSSTNARFSVTSKYAPSAPESTPDYMERKAYTYSCRTVAQTCYTSCNCSLQGSNCYCVAPGPSGCPAGTSPNGQCGCGGGTPCMGGSIGTVVCQSCPYDCSYQVCDVLIAQTGYTNSGTEWYKVS